MSWIDLDNTMTEPETGETEHALSENAVHAGRFTAEKYGVTSGANDRTWEDERGRPVA